MKYNEETEKLAYSIAVISMTLDEMTKISNKFHSKQIDAIEYALDVLQEEYRRRINERG